MRDIRSYASKVDYFDLCKFRHVGLFIVQSLIIENAQLRLRKVFFLLQFTWNFAFIFKQDVLRLL